MRILYDISTLGLAHLYQQSRGGSTRVDLNIAEGLAASSECELLFCANHSTVAYHGCEAFLASHPRLEDVPLLAGGGLKAHSAVRAAASAAHRRVRQLFGSNVLPAAVRHCAAFVDRRLQRPVADAASGVDILHSPSTPLPPPSARRSPARFLTVYDLSYLRFPDLYGPAYRRTSMAAIHSLRPGDRLITTSRFIRDELCERGVASADRIHVVPLAAHPSLFSPCTDAETLDTVRRRYGIPEGPYVLSVNSPDPRKNVPQAIHAFARAAREGRDVLSSLVLTGSAGNGSDRIHQAIAEYPGLDGRIVLTGHVPDDDLAPLYSGARVFVYPSIYEGFGLPPLEAMQCGTPAITSNTSSLPEVVGDGGVMVPPGDVDALAGAMLDLARDTDRRRCLQRRALAQASRFSWELSTATTLDAYRAALAAR
jgi:glycosyltransferase involved in cell wall biosynthesis